MNAIGFDLGDTLVEYEGVPLNWEAPRAASPPGFFLFDLGERVLQRRLHREMSFRVKHRDERASE